MIVILQDVSATTVLCSFSALFNARFLRQFNLFIVLNSLLLCHWLGHVSIPQALSVSFGRDSLWQVHNIPWHCFELQHWDGLVRQHSAVWDCRERGHLPQPRAGQRGHHCRSRPIPPGELQRKVQLPSDSWERSCVDVYVYGTWSRDRIMTWAVVTLWFCSGGTRPVFN